MNLFSIRNNSRFFRSLVLVFMFALICGGAIYFYEKNNSKSSVDSDNDSQTFVEPEEDASIYGMITSVKGNKITILKFDLSTMPGAKSDEVASSESASENAISLGQTSSMPGGGKGGPPSGGGPSGFGGGNSSTTRQTKLEELKSTSIGLETIEVPVGIPVVVQSSSGGQYSESGNLRDLVSDTLVVIWTEDEGSQVEDQSDGGEEGGQVLHQAKFIKVTGKVDMDNTTN